MSKNRVLLSFIWISYLIYSPVPTKALRGNVAVLAQPLWNLMGDFQFLEILLGNLLVGGCCGSSQTSTGPITGPRLHWPRKSEEAWEGGWDVMLLPILPSFQA